jgi:HlyD family secretion protein/adhesin transport system membrane fusion protein
MFKNFISDKEKQKADQLRFLSQSIRLEESVNPRIVRLTNWAICGSVVAFIGWAAVTHIDEVARAPGEVTPQGFQQIVQHLEGGLVHEIRVAEGDVVEQGQTVMVLNGAGIQEDLSRAKAEGVFLELQRERLKAFIENREPNFSQWLPEHDSLVNDQKQIFSSMIDRKAKERAIIRDQIEQKKQTISILLSRAETVRKNLTLAQDMYQRRKDLYSQGYISHISFLETEQQVNSLQGELSMVANETKQANQAISEYEARLKSLEASHRDEAFQELNKVESQIAQSLEIQEKLHNRVNRLEVTAPVKGLVKVLNVNTIGGVVQPGQALMEIVPLDRQLVVDVRIPPQHIGHMKVGVPVQVKVSAYDFSRYGAVPGRLEYISPTTFIGEQGERFYRGRVKMDRNYVGKNTDKNLILPGMTVMADIITGNKTVMAYLLKPIHNSINTAFSER